MSDARYRIVATWMNVEREVAEFHSKDLAEAAAELHRVLFDVEVYVEEIE